MYSGREAVGAGEGCGGHREDTPCSFTLGATENFFLGCCWQAAQWLSECGLYEPAAAPGNLQKHKFWGPIADWLL